MFLLVLTKNTVRHNTLPYTLPYVKWLPVCCMTQGAQTGTLCQPRGWEVGERFRREAAYVYLRLIHVGAWQKPTPCCKAIIL